MPKAGVPLNLYEQAFMKRLKRMGGNTIGSDKGVSLITLASRLSTLD
jgi:hypothetical protein